jgi:hypothetical protein
MAKPLAPYHSPFEAEIAVAKLKTYTSSCTDQILAEMIKAGGSLFCTKLQEM